MAKGDKIVIDVKDWKDEYQDKKLDVSTKEEILARLQEEGVNTGEVARCAVVARELGDTDIEVLPMNKMLLYSGARASVAQMYAQEKRSIKTSGGEEFDARAYVGHPSNGRKPHNVRTKEASVSTNGGSGGDKTIVDMDDPEAFPRALHYLLDIIPGHVWNRLLIVDQCGGDVEDCAEKLSEIIRGLAARIKYGLEEMT